MQLHLRTSHAWVATIAVIFACESSTSEPAREGGADPADLERAATYYGDVAALLAKHCVGCHQTGGIAPFALQSYEQAAPYARLIAAATKARTMPPFLADASGRCNQYRDARWLTDEEIGTFAAWSARGAPEGARATVPPPVAYTQLAGDVRTIDIGYDYLPRVDVPDDYRCFLVDAPSDADRYYVTGFDVLPSNPKVAHHLIVFHPRDEGEVAAAKALDEADPAPGYACFGAAGVKAAAVAAWAPGGGPTHFPGGTGVELRGGRALIVQMHYHVHDTEPPLPDRSRVDFEIALGGVTPGRFLPLADPALTLAPHREQEVAEVTLRPSDYTAIRTPFRVRGVFPHMHTLGSTLRVEVLRDGADPACLIDVPRWDFNWQGLYFYEGDGIPLGPQDQFRLRCTYDTRTRDETVIWGEGTDDEMCVAGLFVTL